MKGKVFSSCTCNPVLVVVVVIWMCMDLTYIYIYIYVYIYRYIYRRFPCVSHELLSICVWQQLYYEGMDGSRKEEGLARFI